MKLISIAVRNDLVSVALYVDGSAVDKRVVRYRDDGNIYERMLFAVKKAVLSFKGYLEESFDDDIVTFEVSNSVIVKWFSEGQASKDYKVQFSDVYDILDKVPIRYNFVKSKKPYAIRFLEEGTTQFSVSGVESLLSESSGSDFDGSQADSDVSDDSDVEDLDVNDLVDF